MDELTRTRGEIDTIDRELIALLARRMEAVRQVGLFKRAHTEAPIQDAERERAVFEFWAAEGEEAGLSSYFLGRILREVLNYSRLDQERHLRRADGATDPAAEIGLRVGYQGAPASYSDLTIDKLFASRPGRVLEKIGFESFAAPLDALEAGEVDYALLPIENTIAGSLYEVYRELTDRQLHVVGEETWEVQHCLAALPGARLADLRTIRSHPVALQQCRRFLRGLVGVQAESWYDTAAAALEVARSGEVTAGAICSPQAAHLASLEVLEYDIADHPDNFTRFLLIARQAEAVDPRVAAKTSLLLTVNHRHGALAECLNTFAREGLNLTKLESRPLPERPWEYLFYLDVEGNLADARLGAALGSLAEHTGSLRILGCYPCRASAEGPSERAPQPVPETATGRRDRPAADVPGGPHSAAGAPTSPPRVRAAARTAPREGRRTVVRVGDAEIGGERFTLIIGPCAVESRSQILAAAEMARAHGAQILRGGAFKPRSSPDSFQGLGAEGLELLAEAGRAFELPVVTEVLRIEDLDAITAAADMLQIGARNMQNFELLKAVGRTRHPVLLKRGLSATIEELLQAAEYVLAGGNHQVVLCERGIRTFETATRATLDISAVPVLLERTHLPIIVDPSHAAGRRELVVPLALAAAAAGAHGLLIEAHPRPQEALCDKDQALTKADLDRLLEGLAPIVSLGPLAVG
jgi:3-deoxy-7-phosphoheptulonate synthase